MIISTRYREINAIATELGIPRSVIIWDIVCDAFGFTPKRKMQVYKKRPKNV
jgi:hypothetical protein